MITKTYSTTSPYLSVIMTSRNDEHGGNMLSRMQVAVNGLLEQLEKYRIESELILIDWNPPADKPPLKDIINWPHNLEYCTIRVIVVPYSIHEQYKYPDKIPMKAVIAINTGIRRARGQFILPAAMDILYSEELIDFIASKKLRDDERYRVDRCDVNRNVVQYGKLKQQLDYCRQNVIKVNSRIPNVLGEGWPDLHTNACGDFQLMSKKYWHTLRGYREKDIIAAHVDSLLSYASYAAGVKEVVLDQPMCAYHIDHDEKFRERVIDKETVVEKNPTFPSMVLYGIRRVINILKKQPKPTPPTAIKTKKIETKSNGIPTMTWAEGQIICRKMLTGKRSYIFNKRNWGIGKYKLPETVVSLAKWEKQF